MEFVTAVNVWSSVGVPLIVTDPVGSSLISLIEIVNSLSIDNPLVSVLVILMLNSDVSSWLKTIAVFNILPSIVTLPVFSLSSLNV